MEATGPENRNDKSERQCVEKNGDQNECNARLTSKLHGVKKKIQNSVVGFSGLGSREAMRECFFHRVPNALNSCHGLLPTVTLTLALTTGNWQPATEQKDPKWRISSNLPNRK